MKVDAAKIKTLWLSAAVALAVLLALALIVANTVLGPLNLDEGWYLLAARNFAAGARPYRDFFFTQAPMMPAVYGALVSQWSHIGVLGGRMLTAQFGLLASVLASLAAARLAGQGRRLVAGATVFLLLQCNVAHSYFTVIPKTYALASLFVSGGALALACAWTASRRAIVVACGVAGGALLALAAATRLSLGAMLPVIGLWLLAVRRSHQRLWLWFGIGGALGLAAGLLPFVMADWEAFAFANFFHGGRAGGGLSLPLGSVSRLARNYMPLVMLGIIAVARGGGECVRGAEPVSQDEGPASQSCLRGFCWMALAAFAAAFLVHVSAPFPYDDYQTPIMPLAAIAASALFWSAADELRQGPLLFAFAVAAALFAFTSPMNESWLVLRKDRFWVEKKAKPDVWAMHLTARDVDVMFPPGEPLLTQDAYLAVDSGRSVPPGFEMGPFGYFADLSDDEARRFHVLNRNLALEAVRSGRYQLVALSDYAFSMSAPELKKNDAERAVIDAALAERYVLDCIVPDFGQEHTTLRIWRLK